MGTNQDKSGESSMEEETQPINPDEVCSVCRFGEGKNNYGAITCSSCKVFFRRNEHLNLVS